MYPQTPPTFGLSFMCLYIWYKDSGAGVRPTSNNIVYLGFNSLQKPLKNQLCDDNLPEFLYLTQKNRFIFIDLYD